MKFEPFIRSSCLLGLDSLRPKSKPQLQDLAKRVGLDIGQILEPDIFLDYGAYCNLLELCAKSWSRPFIGFDLTLASDETMPHLGAMMLLGKFNATLRAWIDNIIEYWGIYSSGYFLEFNLNAKYGVCAIMITGNGFILPPRQITQHGLANIWRMVRILTGKIDASPTEVHFTHFRQQGKGFDELNSKLFGCEIHFEAERNQIIFPIEFLDTEIDRSTEFYSKLLRNQIQLGTSACNFDPSASFLLRNAIPHFFGSGECNFSAVAELLGIKPKTLQRRLTSEGTKFSEILSMVRIEKAKLLLGTSDLSVSAIAKYLGYSAIAAFSYAFRSGTGLTPLEYRKTQFESRN